MVFLGPMTSNGLQPAEVDVDDSDELINNSARFTYD